MQQHAVCKTNHKMIYTAPVQLTHQHLRLPRCVRVFTFVKDANDAAGIA